MLLPVVVHVVLAGAGASAAEDRVLKAGAATSNITPWLGEGIVGGWSTPPSKHVHDELHARSLVLDNGQTRLALVVVDSVGVARDVFDDAKRQIHEQTGLPPEQMLMSATHTHSATSSRGLNSVQPEKELTEYQRFVAHRIADGVRRAINQLEPARIGWGAAVDERHVNNRRWFIKSEVTLWNPFGGTDQVRMNPGAGSPDLVKPAGPVDPEICFLSVQSVQGRPIALLANYSLHYVGGPGSGHISADYFATFADRIQQLLGADRLDPPFVGIMSNGTSGDVNNIDFRNPRPKKAPYEQMRLVAHQVAERVFEKCQTLKYHDWVPLAMKQRELTLSVRKPTAEQLDRAQKLLAEPEKPSKLPHERIYAERTLRQQETPATVSIVLQTVRIGELGIATIPFETFAETGLEIKAKSPLKPTFTIELANGSYGYLPTPEQHRLGGYETWLGTNKVEIEASSKIVKTLLEMFQEMADR
jgi:hypothetical protein